MKKILVVLSLAASLLFSQSEVRLNINDKTLEIAADAYMNYFYDLDNSSEYYLGANFIKSKNNNSSKTSLLAMNFKVLSEVSSNEKLLVGIGVKAVLIDNGIDENFISIPLGLHLVYNLTEKLSVDSSVYYGAQVLSFSDAKRYLTYDLNINYEVINNGFVYLGGRNIETQYKNVKKIKFDQSLYAGLKFLF
ncbi:MAG: YfaZ family outer membrane protein [Campylobacterales bacterium]|nr:YfaZ family outer membrane protein [Campylobacterales bacterium]